MASLTVYDRKGGEVGKYDIDPADIAPRVSRQLLHDAVVMYQANLRQGTHQTKSRSEVAGTSQKMYRQKGTGNARAGSKRSGIRRGGGHIFCSPHSRLLVSNAEEGCPAGDANGDRFEDSGWRNCRCRRVEV